MKKIIALILALLITFNISFPSYAAEDDAPEPINVLFVGNSQIYFHSLRKVFARLASDYGIDIHTERCTRKAYRMTGFANPKNRMGRKLRRKLTNGNFDYVVIQPHARELIENTYCTESLPAATTLVDLVRKAGAEPIILMTWAYKNGGYIKHNGEKVFVTHDEMAKRNENRYFSLAAELGVKLAPCGLNFERAIISAPDIDMYRFDHIHPSYAGSYLAAATILYTMFPDRINALPESVLCGITEDGEEAPSVTEEEAIRLLCLADIRLVPDVAYFTLPVGGNAEVHANLSVSANNGYYNAMFETDSIVYSSDDANIADVNHETGRITAVSAGTAMLKAESESGAAYCCVVNVIQHANGIKLSERRITLNAKETFRLTYEIIPENASDRRVYWSSDERKIAAVDEWGNVTARRAGMCTVTARTHNGFACFCKVYVKLNEPKKIKIRVLENTRSKKKRTINLSWKKVKYADRYLVYRRTDDGSYSVIATVTSNGYRDKGVKKGHSYYYKICASNGKLRCRSPKSDTVQAIL